MTDDFALVANTKRKPSLSAWSADVFAELHPVDPERPYFTDSPTLLSFSGGETSARMLRKVLDAHGGKLPDHVVVTFANTGLERPETLRFVHEVQVRWGVPIVWLEWRPLQDRVGALIPPDPRQFDVVGFNSCHRAGEPFEELVYRKQFLPNKVTRYCTAVLKVKTMQRYMRSLGHAHWLNMVGLRYDEPARVLRQLVRNESKKERYTSIMPLYADRITKHDVRREWDAEPFGLGLRRHEGNCSLCFLKGEKKLKAIMRDRPQDSVPYCRMETETEGRKGNSARFSTRFNYTDLQRSVDQQPLLFSDDLLLEMDDDDGECGDACGVEIDDLDAED